MRTLPQRPRDVSTRQRKHRVHQAPWRHSFRGLSTLSTPG